LALNRPVALDLAMTGEVTLTGRVLPIGGVKEKVLAARRSGVKTVIFPQANQKDYDELSAELKEGLTPHFVSTYAEVFKLALGDHAPSKP
jgi:Lon-like ATP-dependent protease